MKKKHKNEIFSNKNDIILNHSDRVKNPELCEKILKKEIAKFYSFIDREEYFKCSEENIWNILRNTQKEIKEYIY